MIAVVARFFVYGLVKDIVQENARAIVTMIMSLVVLVIIVVWSLAVMAQPAGIFWLAAQAPAAIQAAHPLRPIQSQGATPAQIAANGAALATIAIGPFSVAPGFVSDIDRARVALAAGWTGNDAITSVAISFAEDNSGNPTALSGRNSNGTFDFGLWQINSSWWPQFGGQTALAVPQNNANAGFWIWLHTSRFCAWSTFEESCGSGHNGAYRGNLARAAAAVRLAVGG